MNKKQTSGEKDLLHGFNQNSFNKNQPSNIFTQDNLDTTKDKNKELSKKEPKKQTSIRVNADASSMLMSIKNVMRFKNINEVLYHLINNQFNHFSHEQRTEYNAFKRVYETQRR